MRIAVLGGTRFIGPWVLRGLLARGHEILVFHRGETGCADVPDQVCHLHGDRAALHDHAAAFAAFRPDLVLDMGAMSRTDARRTVEVFRGLAARAVMISSVDVYQGFAVVTGAAEDGPVPVPLTEDSMPREQRAGSPDAYDKLLAEEVFRECRDLRTTVLRLPMVYGPGDHQRRAREILRPMRDGRETVLLDEGFRTWRLTRGYVEDVAAAIVLATGDPRATGRTYNVGERDPWSEEEWVLAIGAAAGWGGKVRFLPPDRLPGHLVTGIEFRQDLVVDTSRIRRELGYTEPTARADAIMRTVAWESAQPAGDDPDDRPDYAAEDAAIDAWPGNAS
ncbi:NAD-dependent epimerase/dehydratase family protein [Streptomyces sp. NPDC006385]|uniref:NAD-dependent epimerase/dehydratase family protein n=1 Tax=Streptomyces sp. NPDC006385 TaxID=3156761 RepID=UPI0033B1BAA9